MSKQDNDNRTNDQAVAELKVKLNAERGRVRELPDVGEVRELLAKGGELTEQELAYAVKQAKAVADALLREVDADMEEIRKVLEKEGLL